MKSFLFILLFLFSNTSFGQMIEGTQAQGVLANTNYFRNSLAEKAESAADITDASNILTVSSVSPLQGKNSFLIDATTTGQVVKIKSFNIQEMDKNGFCEIHFFYSGDATLYKAYVEQGGVKLNFTERTLKNTYNSTTLSFDTYKEILNFRCGTSIAANDLVFESTGNGAAIKADKFYNGEVTNIISMSSIGEWQDANSVAAGTLIKGTNANPVYGTVSVNNFKWRRVGQNAEILWTYRHTSIGGGGNGQIEMDITAATGLVIDTSKLTANSSVVTTDWNTATPASWFGTNVGTISVGFPIPQIANGTGGGVYVKDSNRLKFHPNMHFVDNTNRSFVWNSSNAIFDRTDVHIEVKASIPILGWSTNQSAINLNCLANDSCRDTFSAEVSATGVISKSNGWLTGCVVTSTTKNTCTLKAGLVSEGMNCTIQPIQAGASWDYYPQIVTSTTTTLEWDYKNTNSGATASNIPSKVICNRSGTDNSAGKDVNLSFAGVPLSTSSNNLRMEHSTVFLNASGCSMVRSTAAITTSRPAAGQCTITYTTPFSDVTYCHCTLAYGHTNGNAPGVCLPSTPSVGPVTVQSIFGTSQADPGTNINVYCFGRY